MTARPIPTEPGWWWRTYRDGAEVRVVRVVRDYLADALVYGDHHYTVTDDDRWAAPVLTPAEADELRAERVAARRDLARCYALTGADTDDNDPEGPGYVHLWPYAVEEVRTLRAEHDDLDDHLSLITATLEAAGIPKRREIPSTDADPAPMTRSDSVHAMVVRLIAERDAAVAQRDGLRAVVERLLAFTSDADTPGAPWMTGRVVQELVGGLLGLGPWPTLAQVRDALTALLRGGE